MTEPLDYNKNLDQLITVSKMIDILSNHLFGGWCFRSKRHILSIFLMKLITDYLSVEGGVVSL